MHRLSPNACSDLPSCHRRVASRLRDIQSHRAFGASEGNAGQRHGQGKVLLLDVSGVISSENKEGFIPHPSMLATVKEELTRAAKDEKIKAVVLRINSPGGTVTASDIIYHELKSSRSSGRFRLSPPSWMWALQAATILPPQPTVFGPSLDGHGQYRRHHVDRQCQGTAWKKSAWRPTPSPPAPARIWARRSGRCCRKNAGFSKA